MSAFHVAARRVDGRQSACSDCMKIMRRTTQRDSDLKRKFGITGAELDSMLEACGHACMICGKKGKRGVGQLVIDHDHATGLVRGVLCHTCNTGLGQFADDPTRLASAIAYLARQPAAVR